MFIRQIFSSVTDGYLSLVTDLPSYSTQKRYNLTERLTTEGRHRNLPSLSVSLSLSLSCGLSLSRSCETTEKEKNIPVVGKVYSQDGNVKVNWK